MGNCFCLKDSVKINGKSYRICENLGEGGYSIVYLVEDLSTHKLFALKKIICHSEDDQKKAVDEIAYHKKLSSNPYVIDCIDSDSCGVPNMAGNTTSQVFILLPYCKRGTLQDELMRRMKAGTRMSEKRVLLLFRKMCEGIQAFHSSNPEPLAHRDLKTSNVLLQDDVTPVIMDLGSVSTARISVSDSKVARWLQDEAAERCSMPYKPPEFFSVESGTEIDERTDIWSLGCVLYAMCFYKSPFDQVYERGDSVALAVVGAKVEYPDDHNYSEDLIDLMKSMFKVNPEERPFIDWIIHRTDQIIQKSGIV